MVVATKRMWIPLLSSFIISLSYVVSHIYHNDIRSVIDLFPWTEVHRVSDYDFEITSQEYACQHDILDYYGPPKPPIPNIAHFIIGLHDPDLSFPAYLSIRSALQVLQPDTVKLHHTENLNEEIEYLQTLFRDPRVHLVRHDATVVKEVMQGSTHYAHLSDILRLQILYREGGIYLDADAYVLQPFDSLLRSPRDVVMGHEGGDRSGLTNAIILARPGAAFITRWIESYADFEEGKWNQHSVLLPAKMAIEQGHEDEVCRLSPHAFFWPTWTRPHIRWMHEPLSAREFVATKRGIQANNGSLVEGQMAYHSWNSLAWEKYFSKLDEETVRTTATRFNLMVRRFLDDY